MTEQRVLVPCEGFELEALFSPAPGGKGVVITHPHPLYGGDMHNSVVSAVARAYSRKGWATLRFNFRGVGRSGGRHGQGVGEQEDVRAALDFLRTQGALSIDLAGYSFGAWVNARGLAGFAAAARVVMVSPPVGFLDMSFLGFDARIQLVIAGSEDEIGPPEQIRVLLETWNPAALFAVIQGADHFYGGKGRELSLAIQDFLDQPPHSAEPLQRPAS